MSCGAGVRWRQKVSRVGNWSAHGIMGVESPRLLLAVRIQFHCIPSSLQYVGGTILGFYDLAGINMWGWLGIEVGGSTQAWARGGMHALDHAGASSVPTP